MFTSFLNVIIVINISIIVMILERFRVTLTANSKCSDFKLRISDQNRKKAIKQLRTIIIILMYRNGMKLLAFV